MSSNFNSSSNQQRSGAWNNQQQQQQPDAWKNQQQQSGAWNQQQQQQQQQQHQQHGSNTYTSSNQQPAPHVERVILPTQVIEKPAAIHESIRRERVEEIQPIVNVEKLHTEVHQVTQPLYDKEVRQVQIENRTLATEILPEQRLQGRGMRAQSDQSTTKYLDTATVVVEKPAMYTEVERKQVIEEIQPVIYKETIVPTVIQETKPMYQKVVEGPVYTHDTLAAKEVSVPSRKAEAYVTSRETIAPVRESVRLPTQVVEKPTAVHEEIRRETIEEVTPVWNVEKLKTEVHQITAPLYDKEVKPVTIERKTFSTEVLPEVRVEGRGFRATEDRSDTRYMDTKTTHIEKPTVFNEIERTQIIEEIQPVIYKETVVPTVIRETKPVFQKIVEGTVYTQETLAPRSLHGSEFDRSTQSEDYSRDRESYVDQSQYAQQPQYVERTYIEPQTVAYVQPSMMRQVMPQQPIQEIIIEEDQYSMPSSREIHIQLPTQPVQSFAQPLQSFNQPHGVKEIIEKTETTTTTTTAPSSMGPSAQASAPAQKHGLGQLFHRHHKPEQTGTHPSTASQPRSMGQFPSDTQHIHNERTLPNGQKVIEDTTTTHSHTEQVLPTRPF